MNSAQKRPHALFLLLTAVLTMALTAPTSAPAVAAPPGSVSGTVTVPAGYSTVGLKATLWHYWQERGGGFWQEQAHADVAADGTYSLPATAMGKNVVQFTDPSGRLGSVYNGTVHHRDVAPRLMVTANGEDHTGVDAAMVEASSITGRITSPHGATGRRAVGAWRQVAGTDEWLRMDTWSVPVDSSGRYAYDDLPPGTYRIQALGTRTSVFTWFPGVESEDDAGEVVISAGEDRTGVDFLQSTGATVRGRITTPAGINPRRIHVSMLTSAPLTAAAAIVRADGRFVVRAVPAGRYRVVFRDRRGELPEEYYGDAATFEKGRKLAVARDGTVVGIRAKLTLAGPGEREALRRIELLAAPEVKGAARVGGTLEVTRGSWKPGRVRVAFQWFTKDGKKAVKVDGATKRTLRLTGNLRGEKVRVKVRVSTKGYRTRTYTTTWSKKVAGR